MRFAATILALAVSATLSLANQGDASTSYLPAILGSATDNCRAPCDDIVAVIKQCTDASPADDDLEVARCACSMSTLGVIRNCAGCISGDKKATNGALALGWYNAFVNQCISLTLTDGSMLTEVPGLVVTTASALTTFSRPSMTPGPGIVTSYRTASATSDGVSSLVDNLDSQVSAASASKAVQASPSAESSPKVQAANSATRADAVRLLVVGSVVLLGAGYLY